MSYLKNYADKKILQELDVMSGLKSFGTQAAPYMAMAAAAPLVGMIFDIPTLIKNLDDSLRQKLQGCKAFSNDPKRRVSCMRSEIDRVIVSLNSKRANCAKAKNPQDCANKLNEKVRQLVDKKNSYSIGTDFNSEVNPTNPPNVQPLQGAY